MIFEYYDTAALFYATLNKGGICMNITGFEKFLTQQNSITSKTKAVQSRIAKASKVERDLKVDLDDIVKDDESTYNLLLRIRNEMNEQRGNYQNAVRKYYEYQNGKRFPQLQRFKKLDTQ